MSIRLRTSWKRLPRVVRRRMFEWVASVIGAIGIALALVVTWTRLSGIHPILRGALTGVLPFVPHLIVQLRLARAMRRWRREFAESNARLCTHCAHSLAGLANRGACPECGGSFDIELDREAWRAAGIEASREPVD